MSREKFDKELIIAATNFKIQTICCFTITAGH